MKLFRLMFINLSFAFSCVLFRNPLAQLLRLFSASLGQCEAARIPLLTCHIRVLKLKLIVNR